MDHVLVTFCTASAALATGDADLLEPLAFGDLAVESMPRPFLAAYAMAQGVRERLAGRLEAAREVFAAAQSDLFTSWRALCYQMQIDLSLGDVAAARTAALGLRARLVDVSVPFCETTCDLVLAECERRSDGPGALDLAHQALTTAAAHELWPVVVEALESVGDLLLESGRPRDAARLLAAAQAERDRSHHRHRFPHRAAVMAADHARLVEDEGWAEGLALGLGDAVELARRMRGERARPVAGWASLTPTERRVVEKVTAGLTNPQIAEALLMSRATVKTHLIHVYDKLGIANRAELAAAAARREDA
jgi:DNA-binding CsgD family transcriptional regulator